MESNGHTTLCAHIIALKPNTTIERDIAAIQKQVFHTHHILNPLILPPSIIVGILEEEKEPFTLPYIPPYKGNTLFSQMVTFKDNHYLSTKEDTFLSYYHKVNALFPKRYETFPLNCFPGFLCGPMEIDMVCDLTISDWHLVQYNLTVTIINDRIVRSFYKKVGEIHLK